MSDKESRLMKWVGIIMLTLIVGTGVGYQINVMIKQTQPVLHEQALEWSILADAYKAIMGKNKLPYTDSLKKLQAIDGTRVTIYGYMFPVQRREEHQRFLMSPRSSACSFCMPAVNHMIKVTMNDGIPYQRQPMLLEGVFRISDGKKTGFTYSLEDAEQVSE